ncbi:hypothetical protein M3633_23720, partial [Cytobacillus kochii]|nr:hypothetical protein [Cytobacillus kochii]
NGSDAEAAAALNRTNVPAASLRQNNAFFIRESFLQDLDFLLRRVEDASHVDGVRHLLADPAGYCFGMPT